MSEHRLNVATARVAAFALGSALGIAGLQLAVYGLLCEVIRGWAYPLGVVLGFPITFSLAMVCALPLGRQGRVNLLLAVLVSACLALGYAAGALYHAALGRLPSASTLSLLGSPGVVLEATGTASVWVVLVAAALGPAGAGVLAVRLTARGGSAAALLVGARRSLVALLAAPLAALVVAVWALSASGQPYYGAVGGWGHLLSSGQERVVLPEVPPAVQDAPPAAVMPDRLRFFLAADEPLPLADPAFPYCRAESGLPGQRAHKSAILLILESVDARVLAATVQGVPLTPHLRRIIADGVHFDHFFASGDRSSQALTSIVAGLPAVTHQRILSHAPLVALHGFPEMLARAGARTAYFHGSDLSFEQQRSFLKRVGYAELSEPALLKGRQLGWGLSDSAMFERLQHWVTEHRAARGAQPFFTTLFTLSTHDPYEVPSTWKRVFEGDTAFVRFAESVRYADHALGEFYDWYLREEQPNGTVLLVTGDHGPRVAFPGDLPESSTGEMEYRFRVPFVITGLESNVLSRARDRASLTAGHLDVGQTLLPLVGVHQRGCLQGRDLLSAPPAPQRVVASAAGETLEFLYFHRGGERWQYHLRTGAIGLFEPGADPQFQHNLYTDQHPGAGWIRGLTRDYVTLGEYLNLGNHFAPEQEEQRPGRAALSPLSPPLFVSHRGNVDGPQPASGTENSVAALHAAKRRGFDWVEIDVGMTADDQLIVQHDQRLAVEEARGDFEATRAEHDPGGEWVEHTTLLELRRKLGRDIPRLQRVLADPAVPDNLCVELKIPNYFLNRMDLVQRLMGLLRVLPARRRVIIDSFNRTMLAFVQKGLAELSSEGRPHVWQVGYDLPQKPVKLDWLQFAATAGVDWVYIRQDFVVPDVVKQSHLQGLRVMAYPVNDAARSRILVAMGVDGIVTDTAQVLRPR
jgi:glycerophosphoryl diester phosphodiesterase/arylsulfatase A-like enzyme